MKLIADLVTYFPRLRDAQNFCVSEEIRSFATSVSEDEIQSRKLDQHDFPHAPLSANLPNEIVTLEFENDPVPALFVGFEDQGQVHVLCYLDDEFQPIGQYVPGGQILLNVDFSNTEERRVFAYCSTVEFAFAVALINEPRVVSKSPAISRQQRRSLNRGMGFAVDAWTRVSWDLSKETVAKVSHDPSFHKMPLHWCRGHYRRAQSHYTNAIQRPDAFRPEDRGGWWQWIEGVWRGHPAFGVKKSVHAPRLSSGELASRRKAA